MSQEPRVLLTGLMGCGKSTVGTALAKSMGARYLDNDAELEAQTGVGLLQLAERGKDVLHAAESRQMRSLADDPGPWVAGAAASTGDRPDDCAFARDNFFVVYLHVEPEELAVRVGRNPSRPWVVDDALTVITDMYRRRDSAFRSAATLVVDGSQSPSAIVEQIVGALPR